MVSVSPGSPTDGFIWEEGVETHTFYLNKVIFNINVDIEHSFVRAFFREEAVFTERYTIDSNLFLKQYYILAAQAGVESFKKMMKKRNLPYDFSEDDLLGFLELFSIDSYTKVMWVVYRTVRYFADKYLQGEIRKDQVGKVTFSNIRKFYMRGKENGWNTAEADYNLAGRDLAFFVTRILGKKLSALREIPSEEWILSQKIETEE